jgi:hypothetical protein
MKRMIQTVAAMLVLGLLASNNLHAQDDANAKIVGTWLLNIDKTAEKIDDEAMAAQMRAMMSASPMRMIFNEDGSMDMKQGEQSMPAELTFELTPMEDSKTKFEISISGGPTPMDGEVEFLEDGGLLVQPAGQPAVILDREVEVVALEDAKEFLTGKWTVSEEESRKLEGNEEGDLPKVSVTFTKDEVTLSDADQPAPLKSGYNVEAGEEDNKFIVALTSDEEGGIRINLTVGGKDRVHINPEGEEKTLVLMRVKDE